MLTNALAQGVTEHHGWAAFGWLITLGASCGSPRQMTYDLRRLARKGFIQRISRTHRHQITSEGRRLGVFFTKTYTRIVNPSLAELDPTLPDDITGRVPLAKARRRASRSASRTTVQPS